MSMGAIMVAYTATVDYRVEALHCVSIVVAWFVCHMTNMFVRDTDPTPRLRSEWFGELSEVNILNIFTFFCVWITTDVTMCKILRIMFYGK